MKQLQNTIDRPAQARILEQHRCSLCGTGSCLSWTRVWLPCLVGPSPPPTETAAGSLIRLSRGPQPAYPFPREMEAHPVAVLPSWRFDGLEHRAASRLQHRVAAELHDHHPLWGSAVDVHSVFPALLPSHRGIESTRLWKHLEF